MGSKRYFTGIECIHGHVAERFTSSRKCVVCSKIGHRKWAVENEGYLQEYRRESLEQTRDERHENWQIWYANNRDRIIEQKRADRAANPGSSYSWAKENRDRALSINRNYKAKKKGNGGTHTAEDIEELLKKQKFLCAECAVSVLDRSNRHVDHKMPISRGGRNDKDNLQILCRFCNLSKGGRDPIEFAKSRGRLF